MDYGTLSPSGCAVEVLEEILKLGQHTPDETEKIKSLLRQKIRLIIEQCAMVAEDYVADNYPNADDSFYDIGDCIAEALRTLADDRGRDPFLAGLRISQMNE